MITYSFIYLLIFSLCRERSHRIKGLPFRPLKAIPIDLFPHTDHCEVVLLFERLEEEKRES